jgi:hypothetical protein
MKFFTYIIFFALLAMFCGQGLFAQALEPIGGPYTVDANTVLLLHFDGNLNNAAAANGSAVAAVPHSTNIATKISYLAQSAPLAGLGQCVRIDNSSVNDSTYLTVADTTAFDLTGNWTIEAWANIFTFGSSSSDYRWVPRVVMKPGEDVFWHPNYWLEMWGDNRLFHAGYYTPGDAFIAVTSPNNMFVPGEWVHLTFIRDTARAFIACMVHDANKNLKGFLSAGFNKTTDIPKINKQDIHIGWAGAKNIAAPSTDSWLDGFVDEVRISKVVRNFAGPPVIQSAKILANQSSAVTSYPVDVTVFPLNAGGSMTSVALKYRNDTTSSTAFTSVTLTAAGNNKYTGAIPGQVFGKTVQYYFQCTDNNSMVSYAPVAAGTSSPVYYSFAIYQPNVKVLDVTFEEGPTGQPVDHSTNNCAIKTLVYKDYSTDKPIGGGNYSWELKKHTGVEIDSNWVEAKSPFLAVEEFTLDCWIKADSADRHAARIIINPSGEQDWNNANFELSFRNGAAGVPVFTARYWNNDGTGANTLQDTLGATASHVGKWRHVIVERSATNSKFAMAIKDENDVLMFKKIIYGIKPPLMAGAPLRIGRSWFLTTDNYYVGPYRGKIDNVKVYNYPATGITSVNDNANTQAPGVFALEQNYPNPFNPTTEIEFSIPKFQQVSLVVYDLLGRKVKTLLNDEQHAGQHRVTWNGMNEIGKSVASGVYFYQLKAGTMTQVRKMMLVR